MHQIDKIDTIEKLFLKFYESKIIVFLDLFEKKYEKKYGDIGYYLFNGDYKKDFLNFFLKNKIFLENNKYFIPYTASVYEKNFCFSLFKKIVLLKIKNKTIYLSKKQFQILKKILLKNKKEILNNNLINKKKFYKILYDKKTINPIYTPKKDIIYADHIYKNVIGIYCPNFKFLKNMINNYNQFNKFINSHNDIKNILKKGKLLQNNLYNNAIDDFINSNIFVKFNCTYEIFYTYYDKKTNIAVFHIRENNVGGGNSVSNIVSFLNFNKIKQTEKLKKFFEFFLTFQKISKPVIKINLDNKKNILSIDTLKCEPMLKFFKNLECLNNNKIN